MHEISSPQVHTGALAETTGVHPIKYGCVPNVWQPQSVNNFCLDFEQYIYFFFSTIWNSTNFPSLNILHEKCACAAL